MIVNFAIGSKIVLADWWTRSDVLPTQPSFQREINLPTLAPLQPTSVPPSTAPTNSPIGPTVTPRVGGPTNSPSNNSGSSNGSGGNACDPGKPYSGPYCGWSPSVGNNGGGGNSDQPRIGGPQVLGLSDTSGSETAISDIILLAGVLCLALYARSKLVMDKSII